MICAVNFNEDSGGYDTGETTAKSEAAGGETWNLSGTCKPRRESPSQCSSGPNCDFGSTVGCYD